MRKNLKHEVVVQETSNFIKPLTYLLQDPSSLTSKFKEQ